MPTPAWEPGGPLTPRRILSIIRLGTIPNPETDTPYNGHHQPRNLPHVAVCFDYNFNHHGDYERISIFVLGERTGGVLRR